VISGADGGECDNASVRNRARSLAIGVALTPLALFGLVAVYTHGSVQVVSASLAVGLFAVAVLVIYFLERPRSRGSPRASDVDARGEHAVELDVGVRWEREHPDAWFAHRDGGALLVLMPHSDDADRRLVVLVWAPCAAARVGPPDAAARSEHRLFSRGLSESAWVAEVRESSWIADLERDASAGGLRHFIVLMNEETIEVAAPDIVVHRIESIRLAAASPTDATAPRMP
jgi:hypothetical protein